MTSTDRATTLGPQLAPDAERRTPLPGNRGTSLTPQPSPGQGKVDFDFPAVQVGTAHYAEGPTGCTVLHLPKGARTMVDSRGGAVGLSGGYGVNHAICFAGGSVYGLAAAAMVSGAVIYDLSVRDNAIVPDAELGRHALRNAVPGSVPVGRCGAGISASVGKVSPDRAEFSGQGAGFAEHAGIKVLVLTVVNAVGVVVDRAGTVLRGNYDTAAGARRHPVLDYAELIGHKAQGETHGNTTVSAMITNARLDDTELRQVATQVHSSMHRAIQPFHTELDGDVLFALTTDEVDLAGVGSAGFGALASEVAWDAVLASCQEAPTPTETT